MKLKYLIALLVVLAQVSVPSAFALEKVGKEAPKILTTDLIRRQKVESPNLRVSFFIHDEDKITKILINGQSHKFAPSKNVVVDTNLSFQEGINLVKVNAEDEQGNQREQIYLVAYGEGVDFEKEEQADESKKGTSAFSWNVVFGLKYELDDNPTSDASLPVEIEGLDIQGVIEDSEQPDSKTSANVMVMFNKGNLSAFVGMTQSKYSKTEYESLSSDVGLLGIGYKPPSAEPGLLANYLFLNINTGGLAFAQFHNFTFGYQFAHKASNESDTRNTLSAVVARKIFADTTKDAGAQMDLKWEYNNLDKEKLDSFRYLFAVGNGDNGTVESEFTNVSMDFDWKNRWEVGFLFDIGFGFGKKDYPHELPLSEDLGKIRMDVPIRISTALGWQFVPGWTLLFDTKYVASISTKSPYVRTTQGITLSGLF
ncbi:hypothetical protein WDW89_01390 [Deltaproteobacteria bacterium TL4]